MSSRAGRARRSARAVALGFVALSMVVTGATSAGAATEKQEIDLLLSGAISSSVASFPHQVDGAKAAAAAILKKDGVKINITACNDGFDPNLAAACARQAVTDKVDAVIGGLSGVSAALYPTLEAAKIGYFGTTPAVDADYQSPIAFPFSPGIPSTALSEAPLAKKRGCKNVGVLAADAASSQVLADTLLEALDVVGLTGAKTTIPATAPDYSPYVAQVLGNNPDCMVITVPSAGRAVLAIRQSSKPTIPIITGAGIINKQVRDALGPAAVEGATAVDQNIVWEDPSLTQWRADMAAYSSDQSLLDDSSLLGWANVYAVYQASQNVKGTLTSAKLIEAGNKTTFNLEAYPKPINFAAKPAVKSLPRFKNTIMSVYDVKNGQVVPAGTVDVSKLARQVLGQ